MNRRITISQWVYWLERDSILIAYYNQDTHKYSSPTETKTVTLYYIQRPDKFLLQGESPERAGFADGSTYLGVSSAIDSNIQLKRLLSGNKKVKYQNNFMKL